MKIKKKNSIVISLCFILVASPFLIDWFLYPGGLKRLYYSHIKYDENKIRVVEDSGFSYNVKDYSQEYTLNSSYYVPHRILLIPESRLVPVDYEFSGSFLIELFDSKDNPLSSFVAEKPRSIFRKNKDDYYGNYLIYHGKQRRVASSIFAFELGEIPFDLIRLRWSRLKNMKIKITILRADEKLHEYCDSATLVIIPDLRLS